MIQKYFTIGLVIAFIFVLDGCKNKTQNNVTGLWAVEQYDINGTILPNESIGNPMIEFRGNQYMINTSGVVEKGNYSIKDSLLVFDCTSDPGKPDNQFVISHLDSVTLVYYSTTNNNKMIVSLRKMEEEEVGEKD